MSLPRRCRYLVLLAATAGGGASDGQENRDPIDAAKSGTAGQQDRSKAEKRDRVTNAPGRSLANPAANDPTSAAISQLIGQVVQLGLSDEPRQVSQYFSQADRRRLEPNNDPNATPRNPKLDQVMADLKRNFRERYNQDLALADSAKVFGPEFLRPSADPADRARTAGARAEVPPKPTPHSPDEKSTAGGTSGVNGNVSGTKDDSAPGRYGDRSGTSGDSAGKVVGTGYTTTVSRNAAAAQGNATESRTVTIPARQAAPELKLSLVKEGADWRIDVPDSLNAQSLQENLAKHLSAANLSKDQWPKDLTDAQRLLGHHVLAALAQQNTKDQR